MAETLQSLRARVYALRETMNAARLDYFRGQLQLHLMLGNQKDADRLTRQIQNLLNTARPKRKQSQKRNRSTANSPRTGTVTHSGAKGLLPLPAMQTHSGRNATASPSTIEAAAAAVE